MGLNKEHSFRRGRVLVVDDEPLLVASLSRLLRSEHDVVSVGSGHAALTLLAKDSGFDVILCDLRMPGMSGVELYEEILAKNPSLTGRMVFFTGAAFSNEIRTLLGHRNIELLEKPFEPSALRALVRRFVALSAASFAVA